MPYCTKEQVADEFQGITFSATTNPTGDTVDRWITEADAMVDSKVGLRYNLPLSNAGDLILMRTISIMLVSSRVRRRLTRVGPTPEIETKDNKGVTPTSTENLAMKMLNDIATGKTMLSSEASLRASEAGVTSFQVQTGDTCPHYFKKDCEQW